MSHLDFLYRSVQSPSNVQHRRFQMSRPPLPPFTRETATQKARMAEDAWNSRDPERVSLAYTVDSTWRNRAEFLSGRPAIVQFLQRKMGKRAGLSPDQRDMGLPRGAYRGSICVRMARR